MALLLPETIERLHDLYGKPRTIDDVIRLRAQDEVQVPILAYARPGSLTDYELFSGKDLNRLVDEACWVFDDFGIKTNDDRVIAMYSQSDLSYSISLLALLRMGCKVMTVSARLGPLAVGSLLDRVGCRQVIHGNTPKVNSTIQDVAAERSDLVLRPMLERGEFDKPDRVPREFFRPTEGLTGKERAALIMHSSGSTAYPKPIFQSHEGFLLDLLTGMNCHAMNPLPWFHLHGLLTSFQAIWMKKTAYLWNAEFPLTTANMVAALRAIEPEIFHGVPYSVKLLSESSEGMELLRKCKHVTSGGARPPDELGEKLVKGGVRFATTFGLTETGHIGDSMRRADDEKDWDFLRLHSYVLPHIVFNKLDEIVNGLATYEAVFLSSHPALMMSNSDDPPGSYHSGDIFIAHPTIPNAWKYIARNDDCVTLANGEKINPMAMEGVLRQDPNVRDALLFGVDQASPGMLVFQSRQTEGTSHSDYMKAIAASLEEANGFADDFAKVASDMVVILPPDVDYPVTDKNNIIRAAAYRQFADQIQLAYSSDADQEQSLDKKQQLDIPGLEGYLLALFERISGVAIDNVGDDFYMMGVDSLLSVQIRRMVQRDLDVGENPLPSNVVYDGRNIRGLARLLHSLRTNGGCLHSQDANGREHEMSALIERYSSFQTRPNGQYETPQEDVVLLTGSTGALGAHLLHRLLGRKAVRHVYCVVRSATEDPRHRVLVSLKDRGLDAEHLLTAKTTVYHSGSFGDDHLGLSPDVYQKLANEVTLIVHAAWPVHFQLPLATFETHVRGLHNLLELSLATPWRQPARVLFASSVAAAYATPPVDDKPAVILEERVPDLSHCMETGYAMSKIVGERICERASTIGARTAVLRIGQFVGDSQHGIWNNKEAIPLMIQSTRVTHTLPVLEAANGICQWMPVDEMAEACLQAAEAMTSTSIDGSSCGKICYFNLLSPHTSNWTNDVLPALRKAGIDFTEMPFPDWIEKLQHYAAELGDDAGAKLPASKLMSYYEDLFDDERPGHTCIPRFDLHESLSHLQALRDSTDPVREGLVEKFVEQWMKQW
ncbi:Adenylate-forming reductase [Pseudocercospora fuligena]|uniref:Adenylate-forming reductase n=1 Tax=Pseudocercospora fuligena TaxID=685502 RepID=A0A8H6R811_9PEZI|nr:Adenylate-forming reductase [Pseudocercospora fuligena]